MPTMTARGVEQVKPERRLETLPDEPDSNAVGFSVGMS